MKNEVDKMYLWMLGNVLTHGERREDRTGTGTLALFAQSPMEFTFEEGFPILTTKKMPFNTIKKELLWFISGSTNVHDLQAENVHIWDADYERVREQPGFENGELGPIYGAQWRQGVDQLRRLMDGLRNNPTSRRHVLSAWNAEQMDQMALPPCHVLFQCYISNSNKLSLQLYQRSGDLFLGVPFNITSYALLMELMCRELNMTPGRLIHVLGDAHIYLDHQDQAWTQMGRKSHPLPKIRFDEEATKVGVTKVEDYKAEHIWLEGYEHEDKIKADISVGS